MQRFHGDVCAARVCAAAVLFYVVDAVLQCSSPDEFLDEFVSVKCLSRVPDDAIRYPRCEKVVRDWGAVLACWLTTTSAWRRPDSAHPSEAPLRIGAAALAWHRKRLVSLYSEQCQHLATGGLAKYCFACTQHCSVYKGSSSNGSVETYCYWLCKPLLSIVGIAWER